MKPRWSGYALLALYALVQIPFCWSDRRYNGPEGVYWQTLRLMDEGHKLYSEIFCSQFPLFIWLAHLGRLFPAHDLYVARFVMALFAPLALWAAFRLARQFLDERRALIAVALLALDPFFFQLSHQLTGEIPGLALLLWSAVFLGENAALSSALAAAAILIKPVLFLPWLLMLAFKRDRRSILNLGTSPFLCAIGLAVSGWFSRGGVHQVQGGLFDRYLEGQIAIVDNVRAVLESTDYARAFFWIQIPLLILAGVLLRKSAFRELIRLVGTAAALLAFALLCYVVINPDHLVIFSPLVALTVAAVVSAQPRAGWMMVGVFVLGSLYFNCDEFGHSLTRAPREARKAQRVLTYATQPGDLVMGNDTFLITAADRSTPPEFVDLSLARSESGSVTCADLKARFERGDIVAFVMRERAFARLQCESGTFADLVQKHFPHQIFDGEKVAIYTK